MNRSRKKPRHARIWGAALTLTAVLGMTGAWGLALADSTILDYDSTGRLDQLHKVRPSQPGSAAKPRQDNETGSQAGSAGLTAPSPEEWFEANEVVVVNPPPDFIAAVSAEGFGPLEKFHLPALSFEVMRLRTPAGMGVHEAEALCTFRPLRSYNQKVWK